MKSQSRERVRIGAVSYLNSKPLIEGLAELAPDAELILDYPSRLADQLEQGSLDVALIPSVEYLLNPGYEIVSDACVAARGPVLSVKLYSRVPVPEISTLALDEGSRTSAALVRILLAERYGVKPALQPLPMGCSVDATDADAVLLIGDRAMHSVEGEFDAIWDLGEYWHEWTGLPFVFAMWVARTEAQLGRVEEALSLARDAGEERLTEIARREAGHLGISPETAESYLRENLHFRLSSAECRGLQLFQELAIQNDLAPEGVELVFRHCIPA